MKTERRKIPLSAWRLFPPRREDEPLVKAKLETLARSLGRVGLVEGLVGREGPDGTVETPSGRHRREALLELHGPDHEVEILVEELTDEQMLLRRMDENHEAYSSSPVVHDLAVIRDVVEWFGEGRIELESPPDSTATAMLRFAPSFVRGDGQGTSPDRAYTSKTVAMYVDQDVTRVRDQLRMLALMELGILRLSDFEGLSHDQARRLVTRTREAFDLVGRPALLKALEADGSDEAVRQRERLLEKAKATATEAGRRAAVKLRSGKPLSKPEAKRRWRPRAPKRPGKKRTGEGQGSDEVARLTDAVGELVAASDAVIAIRDALPEDRRAFVLRFVGQIENHLTNLREAVR